MPYRFVGSYEYLNALEMLSELIGISSPEQLEIYDKIIAGQQEFSFYSGVASNIGVDSALDARRSDSVQFEKQFKKQTLARLVALARIELAATLSMYGKSDYPFSDLAPPGYGQSEYWQILVDDLAAHINAFSTDPGLKHVSKSGTRADSETLAYLRRMKLVSDMLNSVYRNGDQEYAAMAKKVEKKLNKYRTKLLLKVAQATKSGTETMTTSTESKYGFKTKTIAANPGQSCQDIINQMNRTAIER